jgi:hypothetical protein
MLKKPSILQHLESPVSFCWIILQATMTRTRLHKRKTVNNQIYTGILYLEHKYVLNKKDLRKIKILRYPVHINYLEQNVNSKFEFSENTVWRIKFQVFQNVFAVQLNVKKLKFHVRKYTRLDISL